MEENLLPKYTLKDVLNILQISQTTLYKLRKENGLLTKKVKRRYCAKEIEELGRLILKQYEVPP